PALVFLGSTFISYCLWLAACGLLAPFVHNNRLNAAQAQMSDQSSPEAASADSPAAEERSPLAPLSSGGVGGNSTASNVAQDDPEFEVEVAVDERESWGTKIDFLLSIIGFAVDLANVWRFPYLCYKYGGGAFLLPYFLMNIFQAVPLFYMELVLGQVNQHGPIRVWDICPLARGIGLAQNLMTYLVAFYYNVIIAWCFLFLFNSFSTTTLPWMKCDNAFNTEWCVTVEQYKNLTMQNRSAKYVLASEEFFERGVLAIHESVGLSNLGQPRLLLVICCMIVFTCLYFSLWKGVKTSGKVVYITATMPYILLSILLVNGARLPGASKGIKYFINPDLSKLNSIDPWIEAAIQVFYSTGAGFGVHLSYASYSRPKNNCYRDCLITAAANAAASFLAGFVVFSYLGYMSEITGKPVDQVTAEGPGLVFQVYPIAIGTLPVAPLWSILFFSLLITLGLDSAMGGMECLLTGVGDLIEKPLRRYKNVREIFTVCVIVFAFFMSIFLCTQGGMYIWNLLNNFSAGLSIIVVAFSQAIAVSWFYGLDQFCKDIKDNLGFSPGIFWRLCWKFISPVFILVIIVFNIVILMDSSSFLYFYKYTEYHPELFANRTEGNNYFYFYPTGGKLIGWGICAIQLGMIPALAVVWRRPSLRSAITGWWISGHVTRYTIRHWLSLGPMDTFPLDLIHRAWSKRRHGNKSNANASEAEDGDGNHKASESYPMTGSSKVVDEDG
uniref:Transporter n=1 Tax=Macrostomum lignano TaxID=282301 RepID=A0A1I8HU19_9PLAT